MVNPMYYARPYTSHSHRHQYKCSQVFSDSTSMTSTLYSSTEKKILISQEEDVKIQTLWNSHICYQSFSYFAMEDIKPTNFAARSTWCLFRVRYK